MRYPVNFINVTQGHHQGKAVDFGIVNNKSVQIVYAIDDGYVIENADQSSGGKVTFIRHPNGWTSCYAHLATRYLNVGDQVTKGQQVGLMGSTGVVNGPHLHLGISTSPDNYANIYDVDPFTVLKKYNDQEINPSKLGEYPIVECDSSEYVTGTQKYVTGVDDEGLNVRGTPNGAVIESPISIATPVSVYEEKDGWSRIGGSRWVKSDYLSSIMPLYYVVTAQDGLNVRNAPTTTGSTILGVLPYFSKVGVYEIRGTWARVSPDAQRWVSLNYLVEGPQYV